MSQSSRVAYQFGSLSLSVDKRLVDGSTTELVPTYRPVATSFADAAATVTVAQLKTGVFTMTPTTSRTLTLPTATLLADYLDVVGKSVDITVINLGADATAVVLAEGASGTLVGSGVVRDNSTTTHADSGSGLFRVIMTNVATPAYTVYRLC
jgi:hypothetical protein